MKEELKSEYRRWMRKQKWSPATIRHAMTFLDYLEKKGLDWENITLDSAEDFLLSQEEKGIKHQTLNGWIKQINRWFKFRGITPLIKYYPHEDTRRKIYIPDEKVKEILELKWGDIIDTRRNRAILYVLFSTGIRVSELVSLNIEDINFQLGFLTVQRGKGGKKRTVPLPSSTLKVLREYLKVRQETDPHALFTSSQGRMWDTTVRRIVKEAGERVGVPWLHPHAARHWRARKLLKEGVGINVVAEIMGHSDIKTTLIYLRPSEIEMEEDMRVKDTFFEKEVKV